MTEPDDVAGDLAAAMERSGAPSEPPVSSTPAPAAPATSDASTEAAPVSEGRDASGRFAPKAKASPTATPVEPTKPQATSQTPAPAAPEAPPTSTGPKAPASWSPALREKWGALPPEVQAVVAKRELETTRALSEAAQARRLAGEFESQVSPFAGIIRAQGQDPVKLTGELMRTYSALATGSQAHKATVLAGLVKSFGVDVQALDSALSGAAPTQPQGEFRDPRFDQFLAQLQQQAASRTASVSQQATAEVETFRTQAEFLDDVRDHAAALLRAGVATGLEDAYSQACWANPEIRAILQQREAAKSAANATASTQRHRNAASSVKSSPGGVVAPKEPGSIEEHLAAAMAARGL